MQRVLVILTLLLSGCATNSVIDSRSDQEWIDYANQIRLLENWSLEGKVGTHNGKSATSFNISWNQQGEQFSIRLFGPMGQGTISIYGDTEHAVLNQGKIKQQAANLQELMETNSSIQLPLDYLIYWLKGIPAPGARAGIRLDNYGQLIELEQNNWNILYSEYYQDGHTLPRKLNISKADMSAKIIIKAWEITD